MSGSRAGERDAGPATGSGSDDPDGLEDHPLGDVWGPD